MRIRDVLVLGEAARRDVEVAGPGADVDGSRLTLVPSFVDLCCDPGFPGFPVREDLRSLGAAALAGGFGDLVLSPRVDPVVDTPEQVSALARQAGGVRLWPVGATTTGLKGEELAEIGLMRRAGAAAISDGGRPTRDTVVLRNALEYARGFGIRVFLRPADADLDKLGVANEGPLSAQMGLRGNPSESEEIGIARVIALVRATGADVHLTHVGTARGARLVAAARAEGLPITASTPARNLLLDEGVLADGVYDARFRLHPPLRSAADRRALIAAVRAGDLLLAADHQPRAPEEKELEFELAVPGSTGLESAFATALTALDGDLDAVVRALATGPRALLPERAGGWALVDPDAQIEVRADAQRSRARNDAVGGRTLRGAVVACMPDAWIAGYDLDNREATR